MAAISTSSRRWWPRMTLVPWRPVPMTPTRTRSLAPRTRDEAVDEDLCTKGAAEAGRAVAPTTPTVPARKSRRVGMPCYTSVRPQHLAVDRRRIYSETRSVYVELHAASAFSFLEAASTPEALVERAAALGHPALAVLDRDGVY